MNDKYQEINESTFKGNAKLASPNTLLRSNEGRYTRMTNFLKSKEFLDTLQEFGNKDRGSVIGVTAEYFILHPDGFEAKRFLEELKKNQSGDANFIAKLFTDSIARKLGFNGNLSQEQEKAIYDYYVRNIFVDGVYYHGFNGVFDEAIRKNGLTAEQRLWDWDDIKKVNAIAAKRGHTMLLGWSKINSENQIAYSATARDSYRYAVASPEWFAQFVSEGFHIPNEPRKKEAYYRGDYETAKQNIVELCDKWQSSKTDEIKDRIAYPNITNEERKYIVDFFEKYWHVFRSQLHKPELALIKRLTVDEKPYISESFDETKKLLRDHDKDINIYRLITFLRDIDQGHIDERTKENITSEDIEIIELPDYKTVFPKEDI